MIDRSRLIETVSAFDRYTVTLAAIVSLPFALVIGAANDWPGAVTLLYAVYLCAWASAGRFILALPARRARG